MSQLGSDSRYTPVQCILLLGRQSLAKVPRYGPTSHCAVDQHIVHFGRNCVPQLIQLRSKPYCKAGRTCVATWPKICSNMPENVLQSASKPTQLVLQYGHERVVRLARKTHTQVSILGPNYVAKWLENVLQHGRNHVTKCHKFGPDCVAKWPGKVVQLGRKCVTQVSTLGPNYVAKWPEQRCNFAEHVHKFRCKMHENCG